MKRKVGIAIGYYQRAYGDMRAIEIAKEIGADAVDFDLSTNLYDVANPDSIYAKSEEEFVAYFTALKNRADELGIEVCQTHGRITTYLKDKDEFNANVFVNARLDCYATKLLGAPYTVMHDISTCGMGTPDVDPKFMHDMSFEIYNKILVYAKEFGVIVANETLGDAPPQKCCDFFGSTDEFIMTYNRIIAVGDNAKYFKMCLDPGHTNKATRFYDNPKPPKAVRMMGGNIVCLHLNDNDTFTDQHKIPFTGTIDWADLFNALDEIGYSGVYNMEIVTAAYGEKEMAIETGAFAVKVLRTYLKKRYPQDFAE